eukprot:GFUD01033045.1.p1 GENE.GFUD01033045.1~~GFUD01033045.1.p1  ORF type:complete len:100 (-),score=21.31 GFUD01033045.1:67-366(-)
MFVGCGMELCYVHRLWFETSNILFISVHTTTPPISCVLLYTARLDVGQATSAKVLAALASSCLCSTQEHTKLTTQVQPVTRLDPPSTLTVVREFEYFTQ